MVIIAVLGVLQIIGGLFTFWAAKSAIHEILATLLMGFGFLMIGLAVVVWRLDAVLVELKSSGRSLFLVSRPDVELPPLPRWKIIHEEWRGKEHWRLRADGRWEVKRPWRGWKIAEQ